MRNPLRFGAVVAFGVSVGAASAPAAPAPASSAAPAPTSSAAPPSSNETGPVAPSPGRVAPPDIEDVEHMCALLLGCDRVPIATSVPRDLAGCVRAMSAELSSSRALEVSLTLRECGLRASSCGQLRACALRGVRPDLCAGRGKTAPVDMCDAEGRAVTCAREQVAAVRDCPRGGEQCAIVDGRAQCSLGACIGDSPASCSASGTRVVECRSGRLLSVDCAALGLKCAALPGGSVCVAPTAACTGEATRCDGSVAVACRNGHEVKVDCGAQRLECGGSGPAIGACTAPEATCDPMGGARCDGARVRYCEHGRSRAYLCRALGMTRCIADARGPRCAP